MEFKRCNRCGNFFVSSNTDICYNCEVKDRNDMIKLSNVLESSNISSVSELSQNSGVKEQNINRFIDNGFIIL